MSEKPVRTQTRKAKPEDLKLSFSIPRGAVSSVSLVFGLFATYKLYELSQNPWLAIGAMILTYLVTNGVSGTETAGILEKSIELWKQYKYRESEEQPKEQTQELPQ